MKILKTIDSRIFKDQQEFSDVLKRKFLQSNLTLDLRLQNAIENALSEPDETAIPDIYKIELWKLIKDVLRLLNCDVQKLEEQIFPTIIEDGTTVSGTIYTSRANRRNSIDNDYRKANNIQRNESLDKYRSMTKAFVSGQHLLVTGCSGLGTRVDIIKFVSYL